MQDNNRSVYDNQYIMTPKSTALPQYYNNMGGYNAYSSYLNQQSSVSQFLKCRPVSSKEEAKVAQIDLDGSLWVFTDIGNNKIYTKQINKDGTASFKTYIEDTTSQDSGEYVTKDELNKTIQKILQLISSSSSVPSNTNELSF